MSTRILVRRATCSAVSTLAVVVATPAAVAFAVAPHWSAYTIRASLSAVAPQVQGTVTIAATNDSRTVLHEAVLVLFPNRFAIPDQNINDANRPFVYPEQEFFPGSMQVEVADGRPDGAAVQPFEAKGVPDGCLVRVAIPATAPGERFSVTLRFRTVVPHRFGGFGEFDQQLTMNGGWYPYLAPLDADGTWRVDTAPPPAAYTVTLLPASALQVVLNGQLFAPGPEIAYATTATRFLSLIAAPEWLRADEDADGTHIVLLRRPSRRTSRISPEPDPADTVLATVRKIVTQRPAEILAPRPELVIIEAPLRLNLTAAAEGMVVVSDRALKVHWLLRPFHELQLAQAVYAELLRPQREASESDLDYTWVNQGLSRHLAAHYMARAEPATRSVQEWIELFNIFAIVDRFETAPKIPFVGTFFERVPHDDELHEQLLTFNNDRPPPAVILGKLRPLLGADTYEALIERCVVALAPFRDCAARESGRDLGWFFTQWLQPYPRINYAIADARLNQRQGDAYRSDVTVHRDSDRDVYEPVDLRLRSIGGQAVTLRWDGRGTTGQVTAMTPYRICQVQLDPQRELIETARVDNARPPTPQLVVDSAEVEVSSTEFGFSALAVGRGRYDYRKDLAVAGFYTNRGIGVDAGARAHWGEQNDPTLYRHNLYAFYSVEALDRSFNDKRQPAVHSAGHVNGLGLRYDYNNIFAYDNPTDSVHLRLFVDWYDHGVGSDYNYADWGGDLVLTHPLWTPRTVLAGEVFNGFTHPFGAGDVPLQGRYSLGGSRSIRGIGAEEELGRNLFLLRGEIRQSLYPEVDLNFLDALVLRRLQWRGFVDAGDVSNSAGAIYDPRGYAVGVGTGLAINYEFMGFFPSVAYIEIATRVDRRDALGDVQFLFGSRQAF